MFKPLLAVLILVSMQKGFAARKALVPSSSIKAARCLEPDEYAFPQSVNINTTFINSSKPSGIMTDPSKRSTSPWDYSINEDPNRFPARIVEATCRRKGCVDATGQENYSMNSVPILQEILVIRRQYRGCEQTYQLEKQWVTVGCTCTRSQTVASA